MLPTKHYQLLKSLVNKKIMNDFKNMYGGSDIEKEISRALTTVEVDTILGGKTKILTYPTLAKYNNINTLLNPYDNFVLLYLTKENYGHYCAVARRNGKICFFDSYGKNKVPDEQLISINPEFRIKSHQDFPHLSKLLYEAKEPIEYNEYQYQAKGSNVSTCGRHAACFILSGLDIDGYHKKMQELSKKYNMNYDDLVTYLTSK